MSNNLLRALEKWKGRKFVEDRLESCGYHLHKHWQRRVLSLFGNVNESEHYWDEQAAESVRSAGRVDSNARKGFFDGSYRSEFIDNLIQPGNILKPPLRNLSLVNSLSDYEYRKYSDQIFSMEERDFMQKIKSAEMQGKYIKVENWNGKKNDIIPYMEEFGKRAGFSWKSRKLIKSLPNGMVYELRPDFGHNPIIHNSLPVIIRVYNIEEKDFFWDILSARQIIPGFPYYSYGETPEELVYGLKAHIDLVNILQDAF